MQCGAPVCHATQTPTMTLAGLVLLATVSRTSCNSLWVGGPLPVRAPAQCLEPAVCCLEPAPLVVCSTPAPTCAFLCLCTDTRLAPFHLETSHAVIDINTPLVKSHVKVNTTKSARLLRLIRLSPPTLLPWLRLSGFICHPAGHGEIRI